MRRAADDVMMRVARARMDGGKLVMNETEADYDLLFSVEFPAVMRTVYLMLHDLEWAEDITQDAFVQLLKHWRKVARYDRPGRVGPAGRHPTCG